MKKVYLIVIYRLNIVGLLQGQTFRQSLLKKLKEYDLEIKYLDPDKSLLSQIAPAQVVINGFQVIDRSLIENCPNLKLIQQSGIGVDNIDIKYCSSKGSHLPMQSLLQNTLFS